MATVMRPRLQAARDVLVVCTAAGWSLTPPQAEAPYRVDFETLRALCTSGVGPIDELDGALVAELIGAGAVVPASRGGRVTSGGAPTATIRTEPLPGTMLLESVP